MRCLPGPPEYPCNAHIPKKSNVLKIPCINNLGVVAGLLAAVSQLARLTLRLLIHWIFNTLDFFLDMGVAWVFWGAGQTSHTYGIINTWASAKCLEFLSKHNIS